MIVVGAHYLPFAFLYGMRQFLVLGALLIAAGLLIGLYVPSSFSLGAWIAAALIFIFAFTGRSVANQSV
jgi:amino acid permease